MTASEARQVFGDTISCMYYNGSDYVSGVFSYDSYNTWTPDSISSADGSYTYEGNVWLQYTASLSGLSSNPNFITVDLSPLYSIFDTTQIHTCIALTTSQSISTVYQSPAWDWVFSGVSYHIENSDTSANGNYHAYFNHAGFSLTYVCADLMSQSLSSGYSSRAVFYGNSGLSPMRLYIGVPYVDISASGETGTFPVTTGGGSSGDTNINVNVDMSETNEKIDETNGLLGNIISWIGDFFVNLGTAVSGWFVPSQNYISNWVGSIVTQLEEAFSPWPSLDSSLTTALNALLGALGEGGASAIEFPAIDVPMPDGVNTDFKIDSISVPIGQNGPWSDLVRDYVKPIINMVSTIAVFNMVLHRIKAVFVGEQVVEVEGSD